jgi:hypothetical protein
MAAKTWTCAGASAARCGYEGGATLDRQTAEATRKAVTGQALLFPPGWRSAVVAGLHVAQVVREGGPLARLAGIPGGLLEAGRLRRAGAG